MKRAVMGLVLLGLIGGVFIYMRKPKATLVKQNPLMTALTQSLTELKSMTAPGTIFHNPLNMRYTANTAKNPWLGLTGYWDGKNGKFCKFESDEYGFRAAAYNLGNYAKAGVTKIDAIIRKWAPPGKEEGVADVNDTEKYIDVVSKMMGLPRSMPIIKAQWPWLLQAMAKVETGKTYNIDVIKKGISLL